MSHPFDARRGLVVVPVKLVGPTGEAVVRLALDTGATATLINAGILVALGYDPALSEKRTQVTTGSGVEFVPKVSITQVKALGTTRNSLSVLCHTLPPSASVDGLLGLDFFRGTKLFIDFKTGLIDIT